MQIVFDNIIFSKERQGGISVYWSELIREFAGDSEAYFYEEKGACENLLRRRLNFKNIIPHLQLPLPVARLCPIFFRQGKGPVLYHSSFYRKPLTSSVVCEITTIHDFTHNRFSAPVNRTLHNYLKYSSIRRAKGVICISNNTFNDLNRYCKPVKGQKTAVIYNGVSDDYKLLANRKKEQEMFLNQLGVKDKFLLFVGARAGYKNFSFAIKLLAELTKYQMVLVGNELSENEKSAIGKKGLERIVVAESISNQDLNILYNSAHALLYPSSYEGFGIPIIEAMKAGCPVLALNTSSIPEVAGDAAILFDYLNIPSFIKAINLLADQSYREQIICRGIENSKKFDWEKCRKDTMAFYNEVYSNNS